MIKALKRKFVFTAMAAVSVLLVILLGVINIANAVSTVKRTDRLLSDVARLGSSELPPNGKEPGEGAPKPGEPEKPMGEGRFFFPAPTENDRMAAVYFTVSFSKENEIVRVDTSRIASIDNAAAQRIAASVINGAESGRTGSFKYLKTSSPDSLGSTVVFMDITTERTAVLRVGVLSLLAGLACWGVMLLMVSLLSGRAVKPIAENFEKQKRFVTDAGHEIKTPLAVILANTEALELYCGENKWSRNIREQTVRLNSLMQNLLRLAKSDENAPPRNTAPVSLSETVSTALDTFSESFARRGLSVEADIQSGVLVSINSDSAEALLSVLADNASKYAKENTAVHISLVCRAEKAVLEISNICEALPDCKPEKLFDRFFRADEARSRKNGGSGIGLSVAKSIAESCGGSIKAEYRKDNVIAFIAEFKAV